MLQVADQGGDGSSGLADWLVVGIVAVAVLLSLLSVALMLGRTRPFPGDSGEQDERSYPQLTREPVLIISAFAIIVLAALVLLTNR